jgi:hypothetical protein
MRISGHGVWMLVLAAITAVGAGNAQADDINGRDVLWYGVHGSYYTQYERGALGIDSRMDLGSAFSAGFLLDYVFQSNDRTTWVTNADLQWQHPLPGLRLDGWVGAGLGVARDDFPGPNRHADYLPISVFFAGVGLAKHPVMPYAEWRFMSNRVFHGVVQVGVRF